MSEDKNLSTLVSRLQFARAKLNISQAELARRIGVSPQAIQSLEAGKSKKTAYGFEIATALGVNPDWLIYGEPHAMDLPQLETGRTASNTEILRLAQTIASLPPDDLAKLKRVLAALDVNLSEPPTNN